MSRTTLVSVDLDDLACYHAIHGLRHERNDEDPILERCLPRFLELFDALGVKATFFVIGRALERDLQGRGRGAHWLGQALREGHELANHSHAHAYDMVEWAPGAILRDLERCDRLLRELGARPIGFRAPGYTHDQRLLSQVGAAGYRYDSSRLPSPSYYLLKAMAVVGHRVRGRASASQLRGASSFLGAAVPEFLPELRLWEIPMSVGGWLRWPLIGTTLLCAPEPLVRYGRRLAERADYFHLELHGLDLVDPRDPGAASLHRLQPELWVGLERRLERARMLLRRRGPATSIAAMIG